MKVKGINRMNKIQKVGVVVAAVVITASQAFALTENWSAQLSRFLTLQGGTTGVPIGDLIEIGIVSNPGAAAAATTPAQLQALITVFASSTVGTGTGIAGSFTVGSTAPGAGFFGGQVYLVAYNAATVAAATQGGMFTDATWLFPVSDGAAPGNMDLGDVGVSAPRGTLSSGTVTSPADIAGTDAASLAVFPVPEPSTWVLVGSSLLGLLAFRRRS